MLRTTRRGAAIRYRRVAAIVVALALVPAAAAAGARGTATRPGMTAAFAADIASKAPTATYGAFVHFGGGVSRPAILRSHGLTVGADFDIVGVRYAVGPVSSWRTLASDPRIAYLEDNTEWHLLMDASKFATRVAELQLPVAGGPYRDGAGRILDGRGVGVAVVDSGVDGTHPDLAGRIAKNMKVTCATPGLVWASGDRQGECFELVYTEAEDSDSSSGHGTHVAGIVAGDGTASNGVFQGVAPGVKLYGFGVGEGILVNNFQAAGAFRWVLDHGATQDPPIRIVTNSWGCLSGCVHDPNSVVTKLVNRLVDAGVVVLFAAGNGGGTGNEAAGSPRTNGHATNPKTGVIGVANYDDANSGNKDHQLDVDSSRGRIADQATWPDISAPGSDITSSCTHGKPTCETGPSLAYQPYYARLWGTSMATPHAAGVAALMLQANPSLTPAQIEHILKDTAYKFSFGGPYVADNLDPSRTTSFDKGAGLVDAVRAARAAGAAATGVGFTEAPEVAITSPASGAVLDGVITVSGAASDGGGPLPMSSTLAAGDGGDYEGPGALDIVELRQSQTAAAVTYTVQMRDVADLGPSENSLIRLFNNVNGRVLRTSVTCSLVGGAPQCQAAAPNVTNNAAVATSVSVDLAQNTVSFTVPLTAYGQPSGTLPAANSIAAQTRVATFATTSTGAGLAQDVAPGGTRTDIDSAPRYAEAWMLRPEAGTPPAIAVTVGVGTTVVPATVSGSSPSYTWSASFDLGVVPSGQRTLSARVLIDGATRATAEHSITIPAAQAQVTPSSIAFGDHVVGVQSAASTVTVANVGPNAFTVASVATSGAHAGDFPIVSDGCTGVAVGPGTSCVVEIAFSPTGTKSRAATLSIWPRAGDPARTVHLSGTGLSGPAGPPEASFSTTSIAFGGVAAGFASDERSVSLRNVGTGPMTISSVTLVGADAASFRKEWDTCSGATLPVGTSCIARVTFRPDSLGDKTASLAFASNTLSSPDSVALSGTGLEDLVAPSSVISTRNNAVVFGGQGHVDGTVSDDLSGVQQVRVTFTGTTGTTTLIASLVCNVARTSCSWSRSVPIGPGRTTVRVSAIDRWGNEESEGPERTLIVI